jgi:hypothetical protein
MEEIDEKDKINKNEFLLKETIKDFARSNIE